MQMSPWELLCSTVRVLRGRILFTWEVCSVPRDVQRCRGFSELWYHQYFGGCSVLLGDTISTVEDTIGTVEDIRYYVGYLVSTVKGYHQYYRGCSVL